MKNKNQYRSIETLQNEIARGKKILKALWIIWGILAVIMVVSLIMAMITGQL